MRDRPVGEASTCKYARLWKKICYLPAAGGDVLFRTMILSENSGRNETETTRYKQISPL
jgi:hypothetical protein